MKLRELREKNAAIRGKMRAINDAPAGNGGDLSEAQSAEFAELRTSLESTEKAIERQTLLDEAERRSQGTPLESDGAGRELRSLEAGFSVAKAFKEMTGDGLTGGEREYHDEASKGREARGVIMPTSKFFGDIESRGLLTSGSGGHLVKTDLAPITDRRRPVLKTQALGATALSGLSSNLDLPRLASSGDAHWISEDEETTRSDVGFSKKTMGPKSVSAEYEVSRRMRLQSNEAIETILGNDIGFILAQALDAAAIKGGGSKEPTGVMADSNVTQMTAADIDSDLTADMIAALEIDDVSGTRAFLTHPRVIGNARKLKDGDGLPIPISTTFHSERVESSTQCPVVTAGTPNTYPLIYGEWASLYIGYWSGVDILPNPYHSDVASKGGMLLHAFLDCDVLVRHPEGFRWVEVTA